jgi:hypothetical protein
LAITSHHGTTHAAPSGPASTGTSAPSSTPTASAAAKPKTTSNLSGTWLGHYGGSYNGTFKLVWHQTGSHLRGTITISNPHGTFPINGIVHGRSIKFGTVGSNAITYKGTVSGTSMSGTFQVNFGAASAGGLWRATKV